MALLVQKYGGSSVATPEHIKRVAGRVVEERRNGHRVVVVVSAIGDTTDHLVEMAAQVSTHPPEREMDMLLSVGERISIALLAMAIHELGAEAISFTGSQVGIITDTKHTEARILEVRANRLLQELEKGKIVIVAGFQGVSVNKEITTLGRGGSDTTAIALAAALNADRCEILKDVDGVYVAEPRLIPDVHLNKEISYDEMIEMAGMGAGVLKTESIEMAKAYKIKFGVGSSSSGKIGTIVTDRTLDSAGISGIVGRKALTYLRTRLPESVAHPQILPVEFAGNRIGIYSYAARRNEIGMIFENRFTPAITKILERYGSRVPELTENMGAVTIIGRGLNFNSETAHRIFRETRKLMLPAELMQVSQLKISWLLPEKSIDETIRKLYGTLKPLIVETDLG